MKGDIFGAFCKLYVPNRSTVYNFIFTIINVLIYKSHFYLIKYRYDYGGKQIIKLKVLFSPCI